MLQELEHLAKENQKIQRAISERKPFISAQALEHEYLENVSRIDRVATFRGPKKSSHLPTAVQDSLEVAKSMRETKWLPGTEGYQRDLAKSMGRSMRNRCAPVPLFAVKLGYISVDRDVLLNLPELCWVHAFAGVAHQGIPYRYHRE
jgi:hypothetical protein